jgi:hypothetical protein
MLKEKLKTEKLNILAAKIESSIINKIHKLKRTNIGHAYSKYVWSIERKRWRRTYNQYGARTQRSQNL